METWVLDEQTHDLLAGGAAIETRLPFARQRPEVAVEAILYLPLLSLDGQGTSGGEITIRLDEDDDPGDHDPEKAQSQEHAQEAPRQEAAYLEGEERDHWGASRVSWRKTSSRSTASGRSSLT